MQVRKACEGSYWPSGQGRLANWKRKGHDQTTVEISHQSLTKVLSSLIQHQKRFANFCCPAMATCFQLMRMISREREAQRVAKSRCRSKGGLCSRADPGQSTFSGRTMARFPMQVCSAGRELSLFFRCTLSLALFSFVHQTQDCSVAPGSLVLCCPLSLASPSFTSC